MRFESLEYCKEYLRGVVTVDVNLPGKAPYCQYCPFIRAEEYLRRYSCRITDEWLLDPFHGRGECCPIEFENTEE